MPRRPRMVWEDPPPDRRTTHHTRARGYDWAEVAETCRRRPGKWARVLAEGRVEGLATSARRHGLEVRIRGDRLYVRWLD